MATGAQRAHEKRQWLIMANTWLEMIPERQRANYFDAAIRNQYAELEQQLKR